MMHFFLKKKSYFLLQVGTKGLATPLMTITCMWIARQFRHLVPANLYGLQDNAILTPSHF
jgi:hypothetical protein